MSTKLVYNSTAIVIITIPSEDNKAVAKSANCKWHGSVGITCEVGVTCMQESTSYSEPYIRLQNADDASQVWDVSLWSAIVLGRSDECRIQIIERSVSREQCRIFINGNVFIENISRTNITELNGKPLETISPLNLGDKINCGRITLLVEALHVPKQEQWDTLAEGTVFINV